MTKDPHPKRNWFLKDEPLANLGEQDRFSHGAYVNLLATTIDELTPPFTLGVFGSWGVGKSSIVNDLSKKLEYDDSETRAVTIDVWKYSDDSLRRQFLYDLQQGLHTQKALPKGKDYVREVYQERAEERPSDQRLDIGRLWALAIPLLLTSVLTGAGIGLLLTLGIPNPVKAVLASFVAPAALFLVSEFSRRVVVVSKDIITRPVYFSEDQFERKFGEIVKDAKCKKLVIIVDNLDRCAHDLVVDTLSAIKTFLEPRGEQKCIFVIPCDDAAIRQHVKAAYRVPSDDQASDTTLDPEQYAIEYLRKFFSGSIKVDPFLPEEIESYIEHLLGQMKLTEDLSDQEISALIQMVGFLFRENPRQLKQFLNNLTSKYLLAKERETGHSPQINPPIADANRLFLAKVVAIETRFPEMYGMFRNDDNLFHEVHSAAVTPSRTGEIQDLLNGNEAWQLLENFLRTTGHIYADNPKAFFHLKQSEQEARIPNYTQFDAAMRRGDIDVARDAFDSGNQDSNAARTDILIRDIEDWSEKGYESYALNAIRVAVALCESPEADGSHISSEVVRIFATTPALLQHVHQIRDPRAIFEMAEHAAPSHRQVVHDAYVERFSNGLESQLAEQSYDADLENAIADSFVAHNVSLTPTQKSRLRTAITAANSIRPTQLKILSSTQEAMEAFIESEALRKAITNIEAEDLTRFVDTLNRGDEHHATLLSVIRYQALGDQALSDETVQKLVEVLEHANNTGSSELFRYTCEVAADLDTLFGMAEPTHLDRITPYLCQQYHSAHPEQKARLAELMCRYYERATGSRGEIDSFLINDFIPSLPASQIAGLLALHRDPSLASLPWEQMNSRLAERLISENDTREASHLLTALTSALIPDDVELLMTLATKILEGHDTGRAVPLVGQLMVELPRGNKGKGLAGPVFSSTLGVAGHMGEPQNKKLLLDFAFRHHRLHTRGYTKELDSHVLELIVDGPTQEVGFQVLGTGYAEGGLSEARYVAILHKVADWLMHQPATTPLQAPVLEWLEKIVSLMAGLSDDDNRKRAMIQWLSDRQDESLPPDERQQTLAHLESFGQLPEEVLQQLVPRLVYQAQNFSDEGTRDAIVAALLSFYRENSPLNRDSWIDLNDYRRSLLSGDDTQRRLGRRLDRQMRTIRNSAQ